MAETPSELCTRSEELLIRIRSAIRPGLDELLQKEIAELVNLVPDFELLDSLDLLRQAEVAAEALLADPPNIAIATEIRKDISDRKKSRRNPLVKMARSIRKGTPPTRVVAGLGVLFYFAIPLLTVLWPMLSNRDEILGIDASLLGLVAISGAIGSVVSILVRIEDFSGATHADPSILFFTGLFKPIVGIGFSLFVFAVLSSGLIPVTINPGRERFFFAAVSFVAGFSERFAQDIAGKTEKAVGG